MEVQRPTLITQSQKDEHKLVEFSKPQNHIATVNNNDNSKKQIRPSQNDELPSIPKQSEKLIQKISSSKNAKQQIERTQANKNNSQHNGNESNRIQSKKNLNPIDQSSKNKAIIKQNNHKVFKSTSVNPNKSKVQRLQTEGSIPTNNKNLNVKYTQIYGYSNLQKDKQKQKQKVFKLTVARHSMNVSSSNNNINKQKYDSNYNSSTIIQQINSIKHNNSGIRALISSNQTPCPVPNPSTTSYNRNHPPCNLSKQQLYEQNLQLKSIVNQLKQTLNRQKIQTELQRKKNKKYTTKLNRQFKKDFYYNSACNYNLNNTHQYGPSSYVQNRDSLQQEEEIRNQYFNPSLIVNKHKRNQPLKNQNAQEDQLANKMSKLYTNTNFNSNSRPNNQSRSNSPQKQVNRQSDEKNPSALKQKVKLYSQHLPSAAQSQYQKYHKNYNQYKIITKSSPFSASHLPSNPSYNSQLNQHSTEYMIAGIKEKYQELRTQHQNVLNQLERIKGMNPMKKLQEISVYCKVLQQNNLRLANALQICNTKLHAYQTSNHQKDQATYNSAIMAQLNEKIQALKSKNGVLKTQIKTLKSEQKQDKKLVAYLQNLLISKDNLTIKSVNAAKKMNKIVEKLQLQLQVQKQQNITIKSSYLNQLESIHQRNKMQKQKDKKIFQQAIIQRNLEIKRMEKQIDYLTTILDHWRPHGQDKINLEEQVSKIKKRKQSTVSNNLSILSKQIKNQNNQKTFQGINIASPINKFTERRQFQKDYQSKINQIASMNNRNAIAQYVQQVKSSNKKVEKVLPVNTERKRRSSGIKHSQDCKKLRRVAPQHISQLPEYLRYRLIGMAINVDQACRFLEYRPLNIESQDQLIRTSTNRSIQSEKEMSQIEKWKRKYINLAQLSSILIQQPFKLRQQDAVQLSRYVIQDEFFYENNDTNNPFVYFNFQNQIQRIIAKSILKAFIQTYSSNTLQATTETNQFQLFSEQWANILTKNGMRLNTALVSICPTGFISKDKWNQLLNGINIEVRDDLRQWCIGKMIIQSQNLLKLNYRAIVPDSY